MGLVALVPVDLEHIALALVVLAFVAPLRVAHALGADPAVGAVSLFVR